MQIKLIKLIVMKDLEICEFDTQANLMSAN